MFVVSLAQQTITLIMFEFQTNHPHWGICWHIIIVFQTRNTSLVTRGNESFAAKKVRIILSTSPRSAMCACRKEKIMHLSRNFVTQRKSRFLPNCVNLGTRVVTSSFKPAYLNPNSRLCVLHLFGRFCASERFTKNTRNVFPLLNTVSPHLDPLVNELIHFSTGMTGT